MQRMVYTWNTAMFFRTQHTTLHTHLQDNLVLTEVTAPIEGQIMSAMLAHWTTT